MENEVIDAEATEKETARKKEEKDEKKESSFVSFFRKAKTKIDSNILEDKIKGAFRAEHHEFDYYVYGDNSLFNGSSVYGSIEEDVLTYLGETKIPPHSVVIDSKNDKAYYATDEVEDIDLKITCDGQEYVRKGQTLRLNPEVKEVQVIKAGNHYYLYEGEEK